MPDNSKVKNVRQFRDDEIRSLEMEYEEARQEYISKYIEFYKDQNGVTEENIIALNNNVNSKLANLQNRNKYMMETKIKNPEVNAEKWLQNWNKFKHNQGSATKELHKIQKDLKSKASLATQTQIGYNNEYNKFIVYSIFNLVFGLGAGFVTINLLRRE